MHVVFFSRLVGLVIVFNATFNNISVILWWLVLLVEEIGVPRENHWPVTSKWQTLSHTSNVASSTPRHERGSISQYYRHCRQFTANIFVHQKVGKPLFWTWKCEPLGGIVPSHILDHDWLLTHTMQLQYPTLGDPKRKEFSNHILSL